MSEMLTVPEAATLLEVSRPRISQLISAGTLRGDLVNGRRMVDRASLDAYLQTRRRGRPASRTKKLYTLMNADHEAMLVSYDPNHELPFDAGQVIDPLRCPWGVTTRSGRGRRRELNDWWRARSVPSARPGIDTHLAALQADSTEELPFRNLGLSLSDCYWLRPDGNDDLRWEDINFFENPFDDSHDEAWDFWLEHVGLESPDNTSEGALPKRWTIRKGARVLLKGCRTDDQRPLNEVVASNLHSRLLNSNDYVSYEGVMTVDGQACACANFLSAGEEYIPASALISAMSKVRGSSLYDRYCRYIGSLGIDEQAYRTWMSKMIVCDALIANTDRHRRNFGLIRNVGTLEMRPAPLFDSGNCLWYAKTQQEVARKDWQIAVKPFGPMPEQQLALVESTDWFNGEGLHGFADEACEILAASSHATQRGRIDYIREGIERQVSLVIAALSVLRYR